MRTVSEKLKNPDYATLWRRNRRFKEFIREKGHFWIELEYHIHRDYWESRLDMPLDLSLRDINGDLIFGTVPPALREKLVSREYRLIDENFTTVDSREEIYCVTELYGYAPKTADGAPEVFVKYDSEYIKRPATKDPAGVFSETIPKVTTHTIEGDYFKLYMGSTAAAKLRAGDLILISGVQGSARMTFPYTTIYKREGDFIWIPQITAIYSTGSESVSGVTLLNCFKGTNTGWINGVLTLKREYVQRGSRTASSPIRQCVTFHDDYPAIIPADRITDAQGFDVDTVDGSSKPDITEYKVLCADGAWYMPNDSEPKPEHTLFINKSSYCRYMP